MELSRRALRRMEITSRFCSYDTVRAVATIRVRFRTADEIVDEALSRPGRPVIRTDAVEILQDAVDLVPKEFSVDFEIAIEDCRGHDPGTIQDAYRAAAEALDLRKEAVKRSKTTRMIAFGLIGVVLMMVVILNRRFGWFEYTGPVYKMVIAYFLDLLFEVYFEECGIFFTISKIYGTVKKRRLKRLGSVRIVP